MPSRRAITVILFVAVSAAALGGATGPSASEGPGDAYSVTGEVVDGSFGMTPEGASFAVERIPRTACARGADFELRSGAHSAAAEETGGTSCGCLCGSTGIFSDGFESGDLSAWSNFT